MEEPRNYEELKMQSAAFDSRLESLNERLTVLEATRPPQGGDRNARHKLERWQEKMQVLTQQGNEWGHEYLDFLRQTEPLLAQWAREDPALEEELATWRHSLSQMEESLGK